MLKTDGYSLGNWNNFSLDLKHKDRWFTISRSKVKLRSSASVSKRKNNGKHSGTCQSVTFCHQVFFSDFPLSFRFVLYIQRQIFTYILSHQNPYSIRKWFALKRKHLLILRTNLFNLILNIITCVHADNHLKWLNYGVKNFFWT